jgi:hypothetical protein
MGIHFSYLQMSLFFNCQGICEKNIKKHVEMK